MEIRLIANHEDWDEFVARQENTLFVQSYSYGEFYKTLSEDYWIFGIYDEGKLVGGSLVVSVHAKRGNFLYLPYGPILPEKDKAAALRAVTKYLAGFARGAGDYSFLRVSPFMEDSAPNRKIFKDNSYIEAPMHILAETTWLLNLNPSEKELMLNMNKNHRNLIKRCAKDEVKVIQTGDPAQLDNFYKIYNATAKKHKFHKFSKDYIQKEFEIFAANQEASLYLGYLGDGRLDSAAIIIYYKKMAVYRHGASLNLKRQNPTSYLIQWEAIREAKRRGLYSYNFWGIAPENASQKHPFWGITHFKKGFGGFPLDLIHCQDYPLTKKYYINWLIETFRRIKRGF